MKTCYRSLPLLILVLCLGCQDLFKSYGIFRDSGETGASTTNTAWDSEDIVIELKTGDKLDLQCGLIRNTPTDPFHFVYYPAGINGENYSFLCQKERPAVGLALIKIQTHGCVLSEPKFSPTCARTAYPSVKGAAAFSPSNPEDAGVVITLRCNPASEI